MKSFILKNATWVGGMAFILTGWAIAGVVLNWFDHRGLLPEIGDDDEVVSSEVITPEDSRFDDLVQYVFSTVPDIPRDLAEETVSFALSVEGLDPDLVEQRAVAFAEQMIDGLHDGRPPELLPNALPASLYDTPIEYATWLYDEKWREFVSGMDLADEQNVRNVITTWEMFNDELHEQWSVGQISYEEYSNSLLTIEELQSSLASFMSPDQLTDIAANEEAYREFHSERNEATMAAFAVAGYDDEVLVAVRNNDHVAVRALIESGADVNFTTIDGRRSPLKEAVRDSNMEMVELLLNQGADIDKVDSHNNTSLMRAAREGDVDMVRLLASRGANLEHAEHDLTALASAAKYNRTEVVRELLDWGADATGLAGQLALSSARDYGNQEMERMLRDAGAPGLIGFVQ